MARTRRPKQNPTGGTVVGVAWYREDQWKRIRETAADPERLEETYAEWLAVAERSMRDLRAAGLRSERIDVDADEFIAWCKAEKRPLDGAARAAFAAHKLQKRYLQQDKS